MYILHRSKKAIAYTLVTVLHVVLSIMLHSAFASVIFMLLHFLVFDATA